ncbi:MAG: hypothetical protein AABX54_04410 [Nanoarchaeota archaeon]
MKKTTNSGLRRILASALVAASLTGIAGCGKDNQNKDKRDYHAEGFSIGESWDCYNLEYNGMPSRDAFALSYKGDNDARVTYYYPADSKEIIFPASKGIFRKFKIVSVHPQRLVLSDYNEEEKRIFW